MIGNNMMLKALERGLYFAYNNDNNAHKRAITHLFMLGYTLPYAA